jgi:hypothetical protein
MIHQTIAQHCHPESYVSTLPNRTEVYYYWSDPDSNRGCAFMHYSESRKMWYAYIVSTNKAKLFDSESAARQWIETHKYREAR